MTVSVSGWDSELPARALAAYHELCAGDGIDPDTELVAARLAANLTAGEWIAVRLARANSGRPAPDLKPINAGDVVSEVRGARSDLAWAAATCGSVEVRRTVAWATACPQHVRALLATDPDFAVRTGVASQLPDTHPALALLAADPDLRVRAATASHITDRVVLARLAADPEVRVRVALALNRQLPASIEHAVRSDPDPQVRRSAVERPYALAA